MQNSVLDIELKTRPFDQTESIKGVDFPENISFRQLLVTGPPGAGKSTMMGLLNGWPDEGYIDLSIDRWWTAKSLNLRPRQVHLGFPCVGIDEALAVFDKEWGLPASPPALDLSRVRIPPQKRFFFSVNWRQTYVFEFIIPPVQTLFKQRLNRKREEGRHYVDEDLSLDQVSNHIAAYRLAAAYLHQQGMNVYIRESVHSKPLQIIASETTENGEVRY